MQKAYLIAIVLCLVSFPALPQEPAPGSFGLLPPGWRLAPAEPGWHGRHFVSPDGQSSLAIYATPADPSRIETHLRSFVAKPNERLTYLRRGHHWLVASGLKGDRIFYRKTLLTCANTYWRNIVFEYPAHEKKAFDPLVSRVSRMLVRGDERSCG